MLMLFLELKLHFVLPSSWLVLQLVSNVAEARRESANLTASSITYISSYIEQLEWSISSNASHKRTNLVICISNLTQCRFPRRHRRKTPQPPHRRPRTKPSVAPRHMPSLSGTPGTSHLITQTHIESWGRLFASTLMKRSSQMRLNGNQLASFQTRHVT
jgi:hypothetical protein